MTTLNEVELDPSVMEAFARELARACPGHHGAVLTVAGPDRGRFANVTICPDPTPVTAAAVRPAEQA